MNTKKSVLALAALWLGLGAAQAHEAWVEQDSQSARFYFGHLDENEFETSPGELDKFVSVKARLLNAQGEQALKADKAKNAFVLNRRAGPGESLVVEASWPVYEAKRDNRVIPTAWVPAARFVADTSAQQPRLTLDIVPTGKAGEFKVAYQGKARSKAKVTVMMDKGWTRTAQTDDNGLVQVELPFPGRYVLQTSHNDAASGEVAGKTFEAASYSTSLTLVQAGAATAAK